MYTEAAAYILRRSVIGGPRKNPRPQTPTPYPYLENMYKKTQKHTQKK